MNLSPWAATKKKNEPMNQQTINTEHTMRYQIPYPKQLYLVRIQNYYCEERGELHTYGAHSSNLVGEYIIIRSKPLLSAKTNDFDTISCLQGHGRFYHPHALDGTGIPISSKVGFESYSRPILIEIVRIQNFKMSI
jgi:hypothetical protein